jgi:hypothetical protein
MLVAASRITLATAAEMRARGCFEAAFSTDALAQHPQFFNVSRIQLHAKVDWCVAATSVGHAEFDNRVGFCFEQHVHLPLCLSFLSHDEPVSIRFLWQHSE